MRVAFKEWAVIADALGRGEQIIVLRKGGISEGRGGFKPEHPEFLIFPTLYHQQRESVIDSAQHRYDTIAPSLPPKDILRIELFARVISWVRLDSIDFARRLKGQHVWRDEVIVDRFDWGRDKAIHAMAVRVHRLPAPVELPMIETYGGCKSWVELARDIRTDEAVPVIDDATFQVKLASFHAAVGHA